MQGGEMINWINFLTTSNRVLRRSFWETSTSLHGITISRDC